MSHTRTTFSDKPLSLEGFFMGPGSPFGDKYEISALGSNGQHAEVTRIAGAASCAPLIAVLIPPLVFVGDSVASQRATIVEEV